MSTHAGHFIQDQNLNVHLDGASVGGKANVSMAQKKGGGGLGGRKALNDISNSGKPLALKPSRKHNSLNVISIGEDLGVSKTSKLSVGGKINVSKAPKKAQVGRKALSDLTNSGKPSGHQVLKNSQGKKLLAVAEDDKLPSAVAEERFLHNHQKCIQAQRKALDMDYFLKTVGLDDDISTQLASPRAFPSSSKFQPESPLIMEDVSELMIEDQPPDCRKLELQSAVCGSPNSPKPYMHWKDCNNFLDFILMESPLTGKASASSHEEII